MRLYLLFYGSLSPYTNSSKNIFQGFKAIITEKSDKWKEVHCCDMLPVNLLQLLINHRIHLFAGSCSVRNRPSEHSRVTQTNYSWQGNTIYIIIRSFYPPAESVLVHQEPGLQDLHSAAEPAFCPSSPAGIGERRCVTTLN